MQNINSELCLKWDIIFSPVLLLLVRINLWYLQPQPSSHGLSLSRSPLSPSLDHICGCQTLNRTTVRENRENNLFCLWLQGLRTGSSNGSNQVYTFHAIRSYWFVFHACISSTIQRFHVYMSLFDRNLAPIWLLFHTLTHRIISSYASRQKHCYPTRKHN